MLRVGVRGLSDVSPTLHRELGIKVMLKYRHEEVSAFSVFSGAPFQRSF